jgi:hypothetical protein
MSVQGVPATKTILVYNKYVLYELAKRATKKGLKTGEQFADFAAEYQVEPINVSYYTHNFYFPVKSVKRESRREAKEEEESERKGRNPTGEADKKDKRRKRE